MLGPAEAPARDAPLPSSKSWACCSRAALLLEERELRDFFLPTCPLIQEKELSGFLPHLKSESSATSFSKPALLWKEAARRLPVLKQLSVLRHVGVESCLRELYCKCVRGDTGFPRGSLL
ncbi:hypothetical protein SKAU_G00004310 [Synaphobranchus kaupii]|uniref:Uncharacterized protein n=1 Tax=Synaphobranchus kaupii TaxID=118154 RepID=A0A9Q1G9V3_SYNKA|nr:hypothetical protein SKAU_G00004310 [Synaphobranchus kaupii]